MGYKIRTQLGKTNISGNGNNVTQTGDKNQNNSNNTTHNHYHGINQNSQNSEAIMLISIVSIFLIAFINYCLFKYANYIIPAIKYGYTVLLLNFIAVYNLYKNKDFDKKDFLNFFVIFIIGMLSFLCIKSLFSMRDFHSLVKYAQNKTFLEFWHIKREWKIISIYFLIGSILSTSLLVTDVIYTILFIKYSKCLRKQSNLIHLSFILGIAIITYYFIIIDSSVLLKFISRIVDFINKIEFIK